MALKSIPSEVARQFAAHAAHKREYLRNYGQVRPIISTTHKGYKVVAVGNTVLFDKRWHTFPDFLFSYCRDVFGSGWWQQELTRPPSIRHTVVQWHDYLCQIQKTEAPNAQGLYTVVPGGMVSAYLLLAYDLYVLRHHGKLQKDLVRRLRRNDHFRGARYELAVAATCVRAGFEIEHEDERDSTRTHPEFVATHAETGLVISVEAKLRHRDRTSTTVRPGVGGLLRDAARKRGVHPFVVFVELALPAQPDGRPAWAGDVERELAAATAFLGAQPIFDLAMFTNIPHQYTPGDEPDCTQQLYALWPRDSSRLPIGVIEALANAAQQSGNVPNQFPTK